MNAVTSLFDQHGERIAAIIVEPVAGNMGVVEPADGFLEGLRALATRQGSILIFDEVMTGFRVALGGAIERYGVRPDLVTFGKIVGGGFPLAVYAGKREIMEHVAPAGTMYQAGTLSGNPVATAAGIATLTVLQRSEVWDGVAETSRQLVDGLVRVAGEASIPLQATAVGAMAGMFFNDKPVGNFEDARTSNTELYAVFFHGMLDRGVYFAPSQFEALFPSSAHTGVDIVTTLNAAAETLGALAEAESTVGR
jgi:glutamate-1-semialdehyde 2,1-aminomutase